jgi:hypothetical protein
MLFFCESVLLMPFLIFIPRISEVSQLLNWHLSIYSYVFERSHVCLLYVFLYYIIPSQLYCGHNQNFTVFRIIFFWCEVERVICLLH